MGLNQIDWNATGAWFGGLMTAAAVFLAARFNEVSRRREERERRTRILLATLGMFSEAYDALHHLNDAAITTPKGISADPPQLERLEDLAASLASVPIMELPDVNAVSAVFAVRRAIAHARKFRADYGSRQWLSEEVRVWMDMYIDDVRTRHYVLKELAPSFGWRGKPHLPSLTY